MTHLMGGIKMVNILNMLSMNSHFEGFLMTMAILTAIQSLLNMNTIILTKWSYIQMKKMRESVKMSKIMI